MKRYELFHDNQDGIAELLEEVDGEWIRYTDHCEAMKRAAISAGEAQQGHVLVPKKVTNAMIDAANAVPSGFAGSPPHWQFVWDAMLAAATPSPVLTDARRYGPYDVAFMGAGVWAGIPDELPPELVGCKVWIIKAGHNYGKKLQRNGSLAAPGMVADSEQKPVAFWNPAVDHDSAAFSYGQGGGYEIPLYTRPPNTHRGELDQRDAARWRMHVKMLTRKHGALSVRETIGAIDHAISGMVADSAGGAVKHSGFSCAKRATDPQNESAACQQWCGNSQRCITGFDTAKFFRHVDTILSMDIEQREQSTFGAKDATPELLAAIRAVGKVEDACAKSALRAALPERKKRFSDEKQGLYRKFEVRRVDGSDAPGGKHHGCRYFVLDVDHDAFAPIALGAYAAACEDTHPKLARDLIEEWGASAMNPKSDPIALWAEIHRLCTLLKRKDFPALKSLHAELNTLRWMSTVKDDPWDQAIEAVRKRIAQIIETEGK